MLCVLCCFYSVGRWVEGGHMLLVCHVCFGHVLSATFHGIAGVMPWGLFLCIPPFFQVHTQSCLRIAIALQFNLCWPLDSTILFRETSFFILSTLYMTSLFLEERERRQTLESLVLSWLHSSVRCLYLGKDLKAGKTWRSLFLPVLTVTWQMQLQINWWLFLLP